MVRRLELDVSYAARRPWAPGPRQLARWAKAALAPMRRPAVLSVRVVGQARSLSLNAHYRHKDQPTNVLSFEGAGSAPDGRYFLGELVICAPVVAREALAYGKTLESHWAHMTIHGVLHLLGFDHEERLEAVKMTAREIQILDRLGFSNPYG
ncbi:MAG TPA: rRNA maturation RNase YbeY [Steroidobacteraceae bacterium]|nr:rRNA maturation RNase YbeY [Steroidobacteraceae bacterium]